MARIVRWNPFDEMVAMQRQMDRLFEDATRNEAGNRVALDVHENEDVYTVIAELAGLTADDIDITLHDNVLTITGEIEREEIAEGERRLLAERRYGLFRRSIQLNDHIDADNVEATYDNGLLTLTLPKSEASKPRQIAAKTGAMLTHS